MSDNLIPLDEDIIETEQMFYGNSVSMSRPLPKPRTNRSSRSRNRVIIRIIAKDRKIYSRDQESTSQRMIQAVKPDRRLILYRQKTEPLNASRPGRQRSSTYQKNAKGFIT